MFEFLFSLRLPLKRRSTTGSNQPKPQKAMPSIESFRRKRQTEKADFLVVKKPRRLTNSGFLDRAFENAWYLPDDVFDDDDETTLEENQQPRKEASIESRN